MNVEQLIQALNIYLEENPERAKDDIIVCTNDSYEPAKEGTFAITVQMNVNKIVKFTNNAEGGKKYTALWTDDPKDHVKD